MIHFLPGSPTGSGSLDARLAVRGVGLISLRPAGITSRWYLCKWYCKLVVLPQYGSSRRQSRHKTRRRSGVSESPNGTNPKCCQTKLFACGWAMIRMGVFPCRSAIAPPSPSTIASSASPSKIHLYDNFHRLLVKKTYLPCTSASPDSSFKPSSPSPWT